MTWAATLETLPDDLPTRAARLWGTAPASRIGQSANTVYRLSSGEYLRLTHSALRDREFVAAGVDWARQLHANGARVSTPLESQSGALIEDLDGWLATVWRGAPGTPLSSDLTQTQREAWGAAAGAMHRASAGHEARAVATTAGLTMPARFDLRRFWQNTVPVVSTDAELLEAHTRLTRFLEALPSEDMIVCHGDFRPANAIWDGAHVTVIDFDEPVLAWAEYDLARAMSTDVDGVFPNLPKHLETFRRGYEAARGVPINLERLRIFVQLQALLSLSWSLEDATWGWNHDLRRLALEGAQW
jgi:Ser/Thr protein kinase RdoA (MazF antagonist)